MRKNEKYKVAMVSYSNTIPFQFGLEKFKDEIGFELVLDVPAQCARRLQDGEVDLALVPVGALHLFSKYTIVSDYCLGTENQVKTVLLMSKVPLNKIKKVYLDTESRTSVNLVKILAQHFWKKDWEYEEITNSTEKNISYESLVLIGDKAVVASKSYPYIYDLATSWNAFTSLPFVFAVWISQKKLDDDFIQSFNMAIQYGLEHLDEAIEQLASNYDTIDLYDYLNHCISFDLDENKRKAMKLFLSYISPKNPL